MKEMEELRKKIRVLLEAELKFIDTPRLHKGCDIDYAMGKVRAYERVLELMR